MIERNGSTNWIKIADASSAPSILKESSGINEQRSCCPTRLDTDGRPCGPSTGTTAPLIQRARSDFRKVTTSATSCGESQALGRELTLHKIRKFLRTLIAEALPLLPGKHHRARRHSINAHVIFSQFDCQGSSEKILSGLSTAILCTRSRFSTRYGGNNNDRSTTTRASKAVRHA